MMSFQYPSRKDGSATWIWRKEGIVRHERIMPDGRKRNSVRFSIIDTEWEQVRAGLQRRLANHR